MRTRIPDQPELDDITAAVLHTRFKSGHDLNYFRALGREANLDPKQVEPWITVITQDSVALTIRKSKLLRAKPRSNPGIPASLLKQYFISNGFYMDCGPAKAATTEGTLAIFASTTRLFEEWEESEKYAKRFFHGNCEEN